MHCIKRGDMYKDIRFKNRLAVQDLRLRHCLLCNSPKTITYDVSFSFLIECFYIYIGSTNLLFVTNASIYSAPLFCHLKP